MADDFRDRRHGDSWSGINRYGRGLPYLIGNTAQGQTPHALAHLVRPVLELREFYELEEYRTIQGSGPNITAAGQLPGLTAATVPQGEVWHVKALKMVSTLGAGCTLAFNVGWANFRGGGIFVPAFNPTPGTWPVATYIAAEQGGVTDMWWQAGDYPMAFVTAYAGANPCTTYFAMVYARYLA